MVDSGDTLEGDSGVGHSRGWEHYSGVGHSGRLWGWESGNILGLGKLWGWELRGHSGLLQGDSRESLKMGTPGTLKSWALQGHFGVGHSDERGVDRARRRVPGEEKS